MRFCTNCREKVDYRVECNEDTITVRGFTFTYVEKNAVCCKCGEYIYVPEIDDENAMARRRAFAKVAGIISVDEINEMLHNYDIGVSPFSKVAELGEVTVSRYMGGRVPARDSSDYLYSLKRNFRKFASLLEKHRMDIAPIAYEKSRAAVDKIEKFYSNSDVNKVALYLAHNDEDITKLALQKLLFLANGLYDAIYGESLFLTKCEAWVYGPVYRDVYNQFSKTSDNRVTEIDEDFYASMEPLPAEQQEFLDCIIAVFGKYSGGMLSDMTHLPNTPWAITRGNMPDDQPSETAIDDEIIKAYFRNVASEHKIDKNNLRLGMEKYCEAMVNSVMEMKD